MGRLGNQMFELASLFGIGMRYLRYPKISGKWKYQEYFYEQIDDSGIPGKEVNEPCYHFPGWNYWDEADKQSGENLTICGWLQTSKYFPKRLAEGLFSFREEWKDKWDKKHEDKFNRPVILVGFRVGDDYVSNGNYEILNPLYQISALWKYFPNWINEYNILVFSDNIPYAKAHMDCHPNIYFCDNCSDIEQMYLGTKCQHFIIPNSTFSWWQAYLGEKERSIVIRPDKYFKNYLAKTHVTDDFWQKNWISHSYLGEKLDLKDCYFGIPVKADHKDREENLEMTLYWIRSNFNTTIHITEQGGNKLMKPPKWDIYSIHPSSEFHRTAMLNNMAKNCLTNNYKIFINFDCDNICSIMQMLIGAWLIRNNQADVVYPYMGHVARLSRSDWYTKLINSGVDCGIFGGNIFKGSRNFDPISVGHAIMFDVYKFFEGGAENENFMSYGPEDVERMERFDKLGYRIKRTGGIMYHMDHWCGPDSSGRNPKFGKNYEELERIRKMSREELKKDIRKWDWIQ